MLVGPAGQGWDPFGRGGPGSSPPLPVSTPQARPPPAVAMGLSSAVARAGGGESGRPRGAVQDPGREALHSGRPRPPSGTHGSGHGPLFPSHPSFPRGLDLASFRFYPQLAGGDSDPRRPLRDEATGRTRLERRACGIPERSLLRLFNACVPGVARTFLRKRQGLRSAHAPSRLLRGRGPSAGQRPWSPALLLFGAGQWTHRRGRVDWGPGSRPRDRHGSGVA